MKSKMTHAARAELTEAIRSRYSKSAGKDKRKILHEFIAATGYHEKSAIRILYGPVAVKLRQTRQRTPLYDEAARAALIVMWEASDRVCVSSIYRSQMRPQIHFHAARRRLIPVGKRAYSDAPPRLRHDPRRFSG